MTTLRDFARGFFEVAAVGVTVLLLVLGVLKLGDLVSP